MNRRSGDTQLWEKINNIENVVTELKTLLIGQDGSGLCHRVKALEGAPEKRRNFWIAMTAVLVSIASTMYNIFKPR